MRVRSKWLCWSIYLHRRRLTCACAYAKHMACLWVWLHLTGLSSKIKMWKRSKWPIHENFHPRKFPAIRQLSLVLDCDWEEAAWLQLILIMTWYTICPSWYTPPDCHNFCFSLPFLLSSLSLLPSPLPPVLPHLSLPSSLTSSSRLPSSLPPIFPHLSLPSSLTSPSPHSV